MTFADSYVTPTLQYVGTGETTDRVIMCASKMSIDQSGTGPLKFISDMTVSGNRTINLTGSTDGTGEFAGTIGGTTASLVVKSGTGTWTLSGDSLYTGTTTVNGGTLLVTGSIDSSDVNIAPLMTPPRIRSRMVLPL